MTGLDYQDPRLDPQHVLQTFKQHPFIAKLLAGGKMIRYGAKSLPYGGWWSLPPLGGDGWMIVGDSAGFLNSARLKGIHLAIKSGMLAAETAFEALVKSDDSSAATLGKFQRRVETSWIHDELWPVRNFHQGFKNGMVAGMFNTVLQDIFDGGLRNRVPSHPGYENLKPLAESARRRRSGSTPARPRQRRRQAHLRQTHRPLSFRHQARRGSAGAFVIHDTNICNDRCVKEFGSPCQNFCPANVYEMVDDSSAPNGKRISLNPANCVHCKTCDIQDPYQIITWVPPEGGGGPNYDGM